MSVKTLEQKRALYALHCIKEFKKLEKYGVKKKEYKSEARKLPSMIMQNGLITTLTFLKSKAKVSIKRDRDGEKKEINDEALILYQLVRYLNDEEIPDDSEDIDIDVVVSALNDERGMYREYLEKLLSESDFTQYRLETAKALRIAQWIKRIAEGEIEDE